MSHEWEIGDNAELKEPVKGYRNVEIVDFDGNQLVVQTSSGMTFNVWPDELKEK